VIIKKIQCVFGDDEKDCDKDMNKNINKHYKDQEFFLGLYPDSGWAQQRQLPVWWR